VEEGAFRSFDETPNLGQQRSLTIEAGMGGKPFGPGLLRWVAASPAFSTQNMTAPALVQANAPPGLIYAWGVYAALRQQSKPVELLYLSGGEHILVRPEDRLVWIATLDWFRFWLQDYEDPDPAKSEQYRRWHRLRELRDSNQVNAKTPPVH
jgi:hypothetical protein